MEEIWENPAAAAGEADRDHRRQTHRSKQPTPFNSLAAAAAPPTPSKEISMLCPLPSTHNHMKMSRFEPYWPDWATEETLKVHKLVAVAFHPFHPTRSMFFSSSKKDVRVFDLLSNKFTKKLDTRFRLHYSIAIHPGGNNTMKWGFMRSFRDLLLNNLISTGDNVIVGSREGKMCWFDMDLSSKPYKSMSVHPKDIENVAFHPSYPLFASCSQDCTAYVFHGMVYSDLNQNPLIVPLEILRGHASSLGGVYDCEFHPRQPWLFTAGADSVIKLYCN